MNKKIVKIPNVTEEVRIGYSFNYMIKVYGTLRMYRSCIRFSLHRWLFI